MSSEPVNPVKQKKGSKALRPSILIALFPKLLFLVIAIDSNSGILNCVK